MPEVKFKSVNKTERTATFAVDGATVVRRIPKQFVGSIDDYLLALAVGLDIEFAPEIVKDIETPSLKANAVVIAGE